MVKLFRDGTLRSRRQRQRSILIFGRLIYDQEKPGVRDESLNKANIERNCRTAVQGGPTMLTAGRRVENIWMTLEERGAPPLRNSCRRCELRRRARDI